MTPFRTLLTLAVLAVGAGTAHAGADILIDDFSAGIHSAVNHPFGTERTHFQEIPVATDPDWLRLVHWIAGFGVSWEVTGTELRILAGSAGSPWVEIDYSGGGYTTGSGAGYLTSQLQPFSPLLDLSSHTQLVIDVSDAPGDADARPSIRIEIFDSAFFTSGSAGDAIEYVDILPGADSIAFDLTNMETSNVDLSQVARINVRVLGGGVAGVPSDVFLSSIRAVSTGPSFPSFCDDADGSLASCPCANPGNPDSGCDIQQLTGGVRMDVVAQETAPQNRATVTGTGYPGASAPASIVIRAQSLDSASPVVFGDGLRCIGVPLVRLGATFASGGTSTHTFGHGAMAGTGDFYYQLWFRNTPSMYCTPDAFNLSNGRILGW